MSRDSGKGHQVCGKKHAQIGTYRTTDDAVLIRVEPHDRVPVALAISIMGAVDPTEDLRVIADQSVWCDANESGTVALAHFHVHAEGFVGEGDAEQPEEREGCQRRAGEFTESGPCEDACCDIVEEEPADGDEHQHLQSCASRAT